MECEFCKKTYPTQSKLDLHKKTSKICLKIQEKDDKNTKNEEKAEEKVEEKAEEKANEKHDRDDRDDEETEIDLLYKETMGHTRSWAKSKKEYKNSSTEREKELLLYILQLEARLSEKDKYITKLLDNLQDKFKQVAKADFKIDRLEDTLWKIVKQSQDDI